VIFADFEFKVGESEMIWTIGAENGFITSLTPEKNSGKREICDVIEQAAYELGLYFQGKLRNFSVPVNPYGTALKRTLMKIENITLK